MAIKQMVVATLNWVVCDSCGFEAPEKSSTTEAQIEAKRLGFHWCSPDESYDYKDLCARCYAKIVTS